MTAVATETACPKCGGAMFDNRMTKTNPKAPDFKCRNRACDGVIWPPRNGRAPVQAAPSPAPVSLGGPLPYEHAPVAALPNAGPIMTQQPEDAFAQLVALHAKCLRAAAANLANQRVDQLNGDIAGAVTAAGATLFIESNKRGIR